VLTAKNTFYIAYFSFGRQHTSIELLLRRTLLPHQVFQHKQWHKKTAPDGAVQKICSSKN